MLALLGPQALGRPQLCTGWSNGCFKEMAVYCSQCPHKWAHRVCDSAADELTLRHVTVLFGFDEQVAVTSWLDLFNLVIFNEISQLEAWHVDRLSNSTPWSLPWETNGTTGIRRCKTVAFRVVSQAHFQIGAASSM